MDSFSLLCFIAVSESKSFTKAALRVGRTQSAVTQQIANLENSLNTKLFTRGKTIGLTQEGEMLLPYALKIFALEQEALHRFKHPELDGEVRFGVPEDFATSLLSDVLVDFSRAHPRIFLNVDCDLSLRLCEKFKKGELDLALVKMISKMDLPHGFEMWEEPLSWVGNPSASLHEHQPVRLVLSPDSCVYRMAALSSLQNAQISSRIVYTSPSYAGIIAAVRANLGLTVMPITMIPDALESLADPNLPPLPQLHVALLTQESANPAVKSMKKYLQNKIIQEKHLGISKSLLICAKNYSDNF